MKTKFFPPASVFLFYVILSCLISCSGTNKQSEWTSIDDSSEIDPALVLKTNSTIKNTYELKSIRNNLNYDNSAELVNKIFKYTIKHNPSNIILPNIVVNSNQKNTVDFQLVSLKAEIGKIFDPANQPFKLPSRIEKKLNKYKENGEMWAPKVVKEFIAPMPDTVLYLPNNSLANLLHMITIRKSNRTPLRAYVFSSPSYKNFEVENYLQDGFNSFFYSLDCSGYLNAAIDGAAVAPGSEIKASANAALATQGSMFIGGGVIISPLCAAFYGNSMGVEMDTITRIKILEAIIEIGEMEDNDIIEMDNSFDVIWASRDGTSSFNGKAEMSANGGGTIGFASAAAKTGAGGTLLRKSTFKTFNTYISTKHSIPNRDNEITLAKIKNEIKRLKKA